MVMAVFIAYDTHLLQSLLASVWIGHLLAHLIIFYQCPLNHIADMLLLHTGIGTSEGIFA